MKRTTAATTLAMTILLSIFSTDTALARRRAHSVCLPGHSRTITADNQAQVYEAYPPHGDLEVYGCVYGAHRAYLLGGQATFSAGGGGGLEGETLGGAVVAYEESSILAPCCSRSSLIVVRDLRTGRLLHKAPDGIPTVPMPGYTGVGRVFSIVVRGDGDVAWIVQAEDGSSPDYYQVYSIDKRGTRLLAAGVDIDPHSLGLAGSRLYWIQGGRAAVSVLLR
jgi:hypothetical protein